MSTSAARAEDRKNLLGIYQGTFGVIHHFVVEKFQSHLDTVKADCEADFETTFVDGEGSDGEWDLVEVEVPKEPTEFVAPNTDTQRRLLRTVAAEAIRCINEYLTDRRIIVDAGYRPADGDLPMLPGNMMMSVVVQGVLDDWRLYDVIYKTLLGRPTGEPVRLSRWISHRINEIAGFTRAFTEKDRERKDELKDVFVPVMLEEGFASYDEFGFPVTKSAGKK